jgi:hypothetical protein
VRSATTVVAATALVRVIPGRLPGSSLWARPHRGIQYACIGRQAASDALGPPDALTFSAGALATLLCFWAFNSFERRTWRRAMDVVPTRFPSPNGRA